MPRAPVKKRTEPRAPRFYPAYDAGERTGPKKAHVPAKLRGSIKPGTVLILLAGRFRGKRVVFLKQLPSGLLLVTGPYQLNGVPLRRVNQAYCIGTSASVDIKGVDVSKVDDAFFARTKKPKAKKDDEFFAGEDEVRTSARPLPRPTRGPKGTDRRAAGTGGSGGALACAFWLLPAAWRRGRLAGMVGFRWAAAPCGGCVAASRCGGRGRQEEARCTSLLSCSRAERLPCSRLRRSRS